MVWIFQGNPKTFDIDDYLARYSELIYWFTPQFASQISVGDRAYIWRAGADSGVIAIGTIVEVPIQGSKVKHPEALGASLWRSGEPDPNAVRTGIRLDEVRLTKAEGMVGRESVKADPRLSDAVIIKMPNRTVFRLNADQANALNSLWGDASEPSAGISVGASSEGSIMLKPHYRRERSAFLRGKKVEEIRLLHGQCVCGLCGMSESSRYPAALAYRVFEVHHLSPLSKAAAPVCTTLEDLALLCANCHRAVHVSQDVETNYAALELHFSGER